MKKLMFLILVSLFITNVIYAQSTTEVNRPEIKRFVGLWQGTNGEYELRIKIIEGWANLPGSSKKIKILEGAHSLWKNGVDVENSFGTLPQKYTIRGMYKDDPSLPVANPDIIDGIFTEMRADKNLRITMKKQGDKLLLSFGDVVQGIKVSKKANTNKPVLPNTSFLLNFVKQ